MPIPFKVQQADFQFEAGFSQPEFSMFRENGGLLECLFKALEPHGARLSDMRIERGNGTVADFHVVCFLFNFWVTLRVRIDRIEIVGSVVPQEYVPKYSAAIVDTVEAMRGFRKNLHFRGYALAVSMHGFLEGNTSKDFLSRFAANIPDGLGPSIGSGAVMYFGAEGERLLCSVTIDMSAAVPDALFVRTHAMWDAQKVQAKALPELATQFVRKAIGQIGLSVPE